MTPCYVRDIMIVDVDDVANCIFSSPPFTCTIRVLFTYKYWYLTHNFSRISKQCSQDFFLVTSCYSGSDLTYPLLPSPPPTFPWCLCLLRWSSSSQSGFSLRGLAWSCAADFVRYCYAIPAVAFLALPPPLHFRQPHWHVKILVLLSTVLLGSQHATAITQPKYIVPCYNHWGLFHFFSFVLIDGCGHRPAVQLICGMFQLLLAGDVSLNTGLD